MARARLDFFGLPHGLPGNPATTAATARGRRRARTSAVADGPSSAVHLLGLQPQQLGNSTESALRTAAAQGAPAATPAALCTH